MKSDRRMQSRDSFLPELGHLDSVGRQAGRLKISASLQKVSVHIFIGKTSTKLNFLYIVGAALKS